MIRCVAWIDQQRQVSDAPRRWTMRHVLRYVRDTFTIQEPTLSKRDRTRTGCDSDAFETAFREHYAGLCDYVDSYVRSQEVAHDVVQDLFVNLWTGGSTRARGMLRGTSSGAR